MFTGLVEAVGELVECSRGDDMMRIAVDSNSHTSWDISLGDSIAVNGCCLTVAEIPSAGQPMIFEVSSETLDKTNLDELKLGSKVNLERAMRLGDRLGGHLVSGHVDATALVTSVSQDAQGWQVWVSVPNDFAQYVINKGSICLDGVSLTINELRDTSSSCEIRLTLIPTTLSHTHFSSLHSGQRLNVEFDLLGKYLERYSQVFPK